MRIDLIEDGKLTLIDGYDDTSVQGVIEEFIRTGAWEANTPAEMLSAYFPITTDSGEITAVIRYVKGPGEWPDMVATIFHGRATYNQVYRRIDNGPDDVYGCERID
jgi:hypothetical protein